MLHSLILFNGCFFCPQKLEKTTSKSCILIMAVGSCCFSAAPNAQNSPEPHFCSINSFIQSSLPRSLLVSLFFGGNWSKRWHQKDILKLTDLALKGARNPFFLSCSCSPNVTKMGLYLENKLPQSASKINLSWKEVISFIHCIATGFFVDDTEWVLRNVIWVGEALFSWGLNEFKDLF